MHQHNRINKWPLDLTLYYERTYWKNYFYSLSENYCMQHDTVLSSSSQLQQLLVQLPKEKMIINYLENDKNALFLEANHYFTLANFEGKKQVSVGCSPTNLISLLRVLFNGF